MIEKFKIWVEGLIVAISIITIIEMLVPEGNSKKYIKVICSIYILFCIVTPILKLKNINFNIDENYFKSVGASNFDTDSISDSYLGIYEEQIKNKLIELGNYVDKVKIIFKSDFEEIDSIEIYTNQVNKEKILQDAKLLINIEKIIIKN